MKVTSNLREGLGLHNSERTHFFARITIPLFFVELMFGTGLYNVPVCKLYFIVTLKIGSKGNLKRKVQAYFWIYWNLLHLANMVTGDETGVILITLLQFIIATL